MNSFGLTDSEQEIIRAVLRRHAEVTEAKIFGSRAKGNFQPNSDVDLALWGNLSVSTIAMIAGELDELPLPYTFDVQAYDAILHQPLREHIDRVGQCFYAQYYHGNSDFFEEFVPEGEYVTRSKSYARYYARRKHKGGYIYIVGLDPHADLKKEKITETEDSVLVRRIRFSARIPLTGQLNKECDAEIVKTAASLENDVEHPKM